MFELLVKTDIFLNEVFGIRIAQVTKEKIFMPLHILPLFILVVILGSLSMIGLGFALLRLKNIFLILFTAFLLFVPIWLSLSLVSSVFISCIIANECLNILSAYGYGLIATIIFYFVLIILRFTKHITKPK